MGAVDHHPNSDTRRLLYCHYCKEWFNTTDYIFAKHLLKHSEKLPPGVVRVMSGFIFLEDWLLGARRSVRELP